MNMLKEHRRNPTRRRAAPKRFEDEEFVSGAVDRYQHCYDNHYTGNISGNENYYTTRDGRKFVSPKWGVTNGRITYRLTQRDFPESLLEFNSIWRSKNMVIPTDVLSTIASFLNIKEVDKQLIKEDDEFIVGELSTDESASESEEDEDEYKTEDETSEEEWDSDEMYSSDED